MLKTLEITNYQCHRDSSLEFHPGMNVITGSSDSGKSTIIRAMLWGLINRPTGDAFKSWNAKPSDDVRVSFEFDNGWFIKERVGGKNKYQTDEGTFEALRTDVPDTIQNISQITDYNLQTQFQKYFMLQDSPGERAKAFNRLTGLDIIDHVFKRLNAKISSTKTEISRLSTDITSKSTQIEELQKITLSEAAINELDDDIKQAEKIEDKLRTASEYTRKLRQCNADIAELEEFLEIETIYLEIKRLMDESLVLKNKINVLRTSINSYNEIVDVLGENEQWLGVEKYYKELKDLFDHKQENLLEIKAVSKLLDSAIYLDETIESDIMKLEEKEKLYTKMLKDAGICPTCHQSTRDL